MRDDFSARTIDQLAKRAGTVCSNPGCGRPTFGAAQSHDGFVNVGVASHITAAAPGGPRYDPNLTSEQRRHQSNGIWLCQTHGKAVDSDDGHFTVEMLREWKRLAEGRSFSAIVLTDGAQGTDHLSRWAGSQRGCIDRCAPPPCCKERSRCFQTHSRLAATPD